MTLFPPWLVRRTSHGVVIAVVGLLLAGCGRAKGGERTVTTPRASVDLLPSFRAFGLVPRVQGKRPTCSVFVVTGALEYAVAKRDGRGRRLSVEFLNWAADRVTGERRDGGFFSDLWSGFKTHGICGEEAMPYHAKSRPRAAPSAAARSAAMALHAKKLRFHWIKEWNPKRGLTDPQLRRIRKTLAAGWPVCGGFLWPKQQVWKDRTLVMCPREAVRDGHSVLLVGYRDDPSRPGGGVFRVLNTSGPAREGFLTYAYVQTYMNDAAWIDFTKGAIGPATPEAPGRKKKDSRDKP